MTRYLTLVPLAMLVVSLVLSAVALAGGGSPTPPCIPDFNC